MGTVLLFPTEAEAAPLRSLRPDLDIRICGVGAAQTARFMHRLLSREHPRTVVLCGIAGAYGDTPRIGETVTVASERMAGVPAPFDEEYAADVRFDALARVASNTVAVPGAPACGAAIENMEGAVVFAMCRAAEVMCGEIRAVSNRVADTRPEWKIPAAIGKLTETLTEIFRENES